MGIAPMKSIVLDRHVVANNLGRELEMNVMGLRLMDLSRDDIYERIWDAIDHNKRIRVINANAYMFNLAWTRPWLRQLFAESEVTFFDGAGAQLAALVLCRRLPRRTTPPEWVENIMTSAAQRNATMYWLGGHPDTVATGMRNLSQKYGVKIAGYHHGYFDIREKSPENEAIIEHINSVKPDMIFLCMGMPRQELWLYENWRRLSVSVAITAGALVDHVAGRVQRPPQWVSNLGLEWFARLCKEPTRLWRRYIIGLPLFGVQILSELIFPRRWR
jgi:N-acetylglucosaminyldiphosphoundecaprenol N-acetyl-beta-D-mannosaminyltransferase